MKWTPCTDHEPTSDKWYLVTLENDLVVKMQYKKDKGWCACPKNKVIAWMDLPEPYQKEEAQT